MRIGLSASYSAMDTGYGFKGFLKRQMGRITGLGTLALAALGVASLATWNVADPSFSHATSNPVTNAIGYPGAVFADLAMQFFGLAALAGLVPAIIWGVMLMSGRYIDRKGKRAIAWFLGSALAAGIAGCFAPNATWPLPTGLGGVLGDVVLKLPSMALGGYPQGFAGIAIALVLAAPTVWVLAFGSGVIARREPTEDDLFDDEEIEDASAAMDDDEDEGRSGSVLVGHLAHWFYSARATLRRASGGEQDAPRRSAIRQAMVRIDNDTDVAFDDLARVEPEFGAYDRRPDEPRSRVAAPPMDEPAPAQAYDPYAQSYAPEPPLAAAPRVIAAAPLVQAQASPSRVEPDWSNWSLEPQQRGNGGHVKSFRSMPGSARAPIEHGEGGDPQMFDAAPVAAQAAGVQPQDFAHAAAEATFGHAPDAVDDEPPFDMDDGFHVPLDAPIHLFDAPQRPGMQNEAMTQRAPSQPVQQAPAAPATARVAAPAARPVPAAPTRGPMAVAAAQAGEGFTKPHLTFLAEPKNVGRDPSLSQDALEQNARLLEGVLEDFGVKGEIIQVRPGPVVTLYELEPAPGIKSSRVIGLADDIARSMSAIAARVAVVPGRNAIGIELPNTRRETVYLRELLASREFENSKSRLALALGKTINGEAVIADIAKMPHVLVAGTTGSGKSVAINTMVLSLLYRLTPDQCRLIMIDPKMVELSVYDGIPHLLTPVVTDPKKAVVALKWTVREMEDRYRKMAKVGVRNIEGFNSRVAQAAQKGETITRTVQTGFDRETGEAIYESEQLDLKPFPFIVVIIDEVADLMMVAGKDIEGAVQRLGQMARAAGIHVVMATQRPSVDVITGTIKANFPTRMSFQVTSKIDSRTILGEMGAEQLLGMGDMLYMAGGGRIQRVHGPFVSEDEVEKVVSHLKLQGVPDYLDAITEDDEEDGDDAGSSSGKGGGSSSGNSNLEDSEDPYDQAVSVVLRDGKASTSYIQRRLGIGYNRAASIIERMEKEGIVGAANHAGKREILVPTEDDKF